MTNHKPPQNPRCRHFDDPCEAMSIASYYIATALSLGESRITVFLIGDSIAWSPLKIDSSKHIVLWQGKIYSMVKGPTKKEWDEVFERILYRNFNKPIQMELF